jgi:hypothetical protein
MVRTCRNVLHLLGKYFCRMKNNKVADARKLFGAYGSWRLLMNSFICLCEIWTEIYRKLTYILCIKSFSSEGNYKHIDGVVLDVMSDKLKSGCGNNKSFKEARAE